MFLYKTDDIEFEHVYFQKSENINSGIPFNYFLVDKRNNTIIEFFVNNVYDDGNYIYFTYINGKLDYDFCYVDSNLKLARINKSTYTIETISIDSNRKIFNLIDHVGESYKEWLSQKNNQCK